MGKKLLYVTVLATLVYFTHLYFASYCLLRDNSRFLNMSMHNDLLKLGLNEHGVCYISLPPQYWLYICSS